MRWLIASACLTTCVLFSNTPEALASHWRVDNAGGADFTSIQAALDAGGRDSILVASGAYPETLRIDDVTGAVHLIGLAPRHSVSVLALSSSIHVGATVSIEGVRVLGQTIVEHARAVTFSGCAFASEVYSEASDQSANFFDCEFRGRTDLLNYNSYGAFQRLRFISAPLFVKTSQTGPSHFLDCSFIGPADTLVTVNLAAGENAVAFSRCQFESAGIGVAFMETSTNTAEFTRCRFEFLSGTAIQYEELVHPTGCGDCLSPFGMVVDSCLFEYVGAGVHLKTWFPTRVRMRADTIRHVAGDGVRVRPGLLPPGGQFQSLLIEDCGGSGLVVERPVSYPQMMTLDVDSSRFARCVGDGMRIEGAPTPEDNLLVRITATVSMHNGGAGFSLQRAGSHLRGNVAFANGSHGIALTSDAFNYYRADTVVSNTSVGNGGDGIRVFRTGTGLSQTQLVTHNIAALNGQTGIRVQSPSSATDNLAWHNYLSESVGFAAFLDSNLVADPRFCDLSAGDFTLQADSPAAPNAEHDLIGALAVACASTVAVGPSASPRIWSLGPNPSGGAVTFALAPTVSGRLEVFDTLGRRVWAQHVAKGEVARWDGTENGRAVPGGIYQARLVTEAGTQQAQLIRLP